MSGHNDMLYKYYRNYSGIYACNILNVCDAFVQILQPLANVHETKWTRHVKRDCDVAVLIIAVIEGSENDVITSPDSL